METLLSDSNCQNRYRLGQNHKNVTVKLQHFLNYLVQSIF